MNEQSKRIILINALFAILYVSLSLWLWSVVNQWYNYGVTSSWSPLIIHPIITSASPRTPGMITVVDQYNYPFLLFVIQLITNIYFHWKEQVEPISKDKKEEPTYIYVNVLLGLLCIAFNYLLWFYANNGGTIYAVNNAGKIYESTRYATTIWSPLFVTHQHIPGTPIPPGLASATPMLNFPFILYFVFLTVNFHLSIKYHRKQNITHQQKQPLKAYALFVQ